MLYLLPHAVDRSADRAPEHEAFCGQGPRLTYGALAEQSNQLAHALRSEGVRRGDRVGIFLPRRTEAAIAVHGIMKAGAAFVPMDPHLPADGLRRLVVDCDVRHLVTHEAGRRRLQRVVDDSPLACVVGLDAPLDGPVGTRPWSSLSAESTRAPDVAGTELDLAYVMYSSGSTGRPKGIMHTHASGLAYARLSADTYSVGPDDRLGSHSPLHFDMSTFGYFTGPLAGATTLLVPEAHTKVAASLARLMEDERLTIRYSVPLALIQLLLRGVLEERDLSTLRWVLYGGEPFPIKHLAALRRAWPGARFSNVYGPAEVNQCTYHHLPAAGEAPGELRDAIPIGRTWANTDGLVLDADDRPVEGAGEGELVISSPTMMRGYWRRPDLDERAFFVEQVAPGLSRTYYRTGDLVRRDDDGRLHLLGRRDRQVKVRGHRVELDEVEHALAQHPEVDEAAAFPVRRDGSVDHLAAAVIAGEGRAVTADDLRAFLAARLSSYCVPARIDVVNSLPRTATGKIDRRALEAAASDTDPT